MIKTIHTFLIIFATLIFVSCSKNDDSDPSISFTESEVIGTWELTSDVQRDSKIIPAGTTFTFKQDGTCTQILHVMEDSYKIADGKIHTYYKSSGEPMYIYTLRSKTGDVYTVNYQDAIDPVSGVLKMKKK